MINLKEQNISFEIFPPKKEKAIANIDTVLTELAQLDPSYISVTFGAGGSCTNNATIDLGEKIQKVHGIQSLVHLTCVHHTQSDIASVCMVLKQRGIKDILALRGDKKEGETIQGDFTYASDLVSFLKTQGDFTIWGACYPETHIEAKSAFSDLQALKIKTDKGTDRLISQLFFNNTSFYSFVDRVKKKGIRVPIDAGIMPVLDASKIEKMVAMSNATIPKSLFTILEKYKHDKTSMYKAGIEYAAAQIKDLKTHSDCGIHIYCMNRTDVVRDVCKALS